MIITFDNDLFVLRDDGYTSGLSLGWGRGPYASFDEIGAPKWISGLFGWTYLNQGDSKRYALDYQIKQSIYTPTDLSPRNLFSMTGRTPAHLPGSPAHATGTRR